MKETDILIPTSTIGSYAPPSWLCVTLEAIGRGELGETDINETFDDAVRAAIADQERAGVDIITEGEMRRQDFVLGFYERLTGLEELPCTQNTGTRRTRSARQMAAFRSAHSSRWSRYPRGI